MQTWPTAPAPDHPVNPIAAGGIWALLFILVIPITLLLAGFLRWMRRRKL